MNKILSTTLLLSLLIASCTYVQKIKDGATAFDRKQYAVAIPMLMKEHKKADSRIEKGKLSFMIADSYTNLNQNQNSLEWYNKAYEDGYGVDALKGYAYGLKRNEQYKEAMEAFKNLGLEIGSPYEYRREITACKQALDWADANKNLSYTIQLADFNSAKADYSPTIYQNDYLVITSDRSTSTGDNTYNWTGSNFSDLFIVNTESNTVASFESPINSVDNEGTVSFTEDYSEMYFTRCSNGDKYNDTYCAIMRSTNENGSWSIPERIKLFEEENINYGDASISKDGGTLYFSANHPDGWGGHDIYVVEREPDGWGSPKLLGRTINTLGNERFPFIDDDTLYFSTDYLPGMGGLDIFKTYKMGNRAWSPAHNLKAPINSGSDDFSYTIDPRPQKEKDILQIGYFTSTRENGVGGDDIYQFIKRIPPPPPPIDTTAPPAPIVYKMVLEGYVLEKIYESKGNPNSRVLGRKPLNSATVNINFGKKKETVTVGEDGLFSLILEENIDYAFAASKTGYLNNRSSFTSKGIGKDPNNPVTTYTVEVVLDKIFTNTEITLENIYYDYDKWDIRNDAAPTLQKLANTLTENPQIRIQLSSHTDCRGKAGYNESLSQKRAQSVVDYLIAIGIPDDRLTAKGYGENALSVDCACTRCTETEHQANRRTTFKILE
ncbi:MAG: peptidoglycan-associated lipoprotein [Saprospiraceae bacterium]|jgi:peptidoglycan-associated lipoprotein